MCLYLIGLHTYMVSVSNSSSTRECGTVNGTANHTVLTCNFVVYRTIVICHALYLGR